MDEGAEAVPFLSFLLALFAVVISIDPSRCKKSKI